MITIVQPASSLVISAYSGLIKPYHMAGKDDYGTPPALYELLDQEFGFTLDVCADDQTHKCPAWISKEIDALAIDWWGRVFMNPPFTQLDKFLVKLVKELVAGRIEIAVALIASRTDTNAMFMASSYAGETRFLKGRVSYEIHPNAFQRQQVAILKDISIPPEVWPEITKMVGLPKTAIQALIANPDLPGGSKGLSIGAPFPSTVLIFDRREVPSTVYWDWKKGKETAYAFGKGGTEYTSPLKGVIQSAVAKQKLWHMQEPPKPKPKPTVLLAGPGTLYDLFEKDYLDVEE